MGARSFVISLAALACMSTACLAAEDNGGRYTMSPAEEGVVRLDTMTGAMAHCMRKAGRWACEDMQDSQRILMGEIDKLQAENKSLKEQVEHLEKTLETGDDQAEAPKPSTKFALPSEQDVDKAFDYLERMLKKLHERMERLEEEHGSAL